MALVAVDGKATLGSNVPPTLPLDRPLVSRGIISEGSLEDSDNLLHFADKKDACPLVSGLNVIPCAQEAEPFEVCEGSLVDADEGKRLNRPARSWRDLGARPPAPGPGRPPLAMSHEP